jgi:hypothetical protein
MDSFYSSYTSYSRKNNLFQPNMDHRLRTFEVDRKVIKDLISLDNPGFRFSKTEDIV